MNLNRFTKKEILWLAQNKCKHSHTYLEHPKCLGIDNPPDSPIFERIGHLDIESTNLKANFALIISYAIKIDGGEIIGRAIKPSELRNRTYDRALLEECVADMRKFDRITTYYGGDFRFDIPVLRTRCIHFRLDFPLYKEIKVTDVYSIVKKKINLHRRGLATVCDFFDIPAKNNPLKPAIWTGVMAGHQDAIDYVWEHNKEDVCSLEAVYNLLMPYVNRANTSI